LILLTAAIYVNGQSVDRISYSILRSKDRTDIRNPNLGGTVLGLSGVGTCVSGLSKRHCGVLAYNGPTILSRELIANV